MLKFNIEQKTSPKVMINIGALLDIPTAAIVRGRKNESIFNGGLGNATGVAGAGNNFKSSLIHYMMLSAADKIAEAVGATAMTTYDTECNIVLERLDYLASKFKHLPENITTSDKISWEVTDKDKIPANKWMVDLNKYVEEKVKDKSIKVKVECFTDPYTKKELEMNIPTFVEIDSLTEFEPESTMDMLSTDLDTSDSNTYAMKQGLFKTKVLSTIPTMANRSNTYFLVTAHIGQKIDMATGPAKYQQPTKNLQFLKTGDALKGVSTKFTFLLNNAWFANTASLLTNQTTKLAEYPRHGEDEQKTDLNVVRLTQLRGKNGGSGFSLELVISQTEGVLPSLTEFHFIKENNRYGLEGNNTNYHLDLLPDVNLTRTTVRSKLDENPKLRRAVNLTADLLQCKIFQPSIHVDGLYCTPKELYEDIKKLGYDWDILLNTRGYWTINQYTNKVPFLSIVDLLRMRKEEYFPYFLDKDKKLKAEYAR